MVFSVGDCNLSKDSRGEAQYAGTKSMNTAICRRRAGTKPLGTASRSLRYGRVLFTCFLLCLMALPVIASAGTEVIVPWDDAGKVRRMSAELRSRLDLWPGLYPGFEEASLLRDETGAHLLQVVWRDGRIVVQNRVALRPGEVDSLRARISSALAPEWDSREESAKNARVPLLVATTVVGLGLYSWGVPVATDLNGKTAVSVGMLCAGASFVIPYFATRHEVVTPGMANLGIYGLTRGIAHGAVLHRLVTGPRGDGGSRGGAAAAGSVVEGVAGYLWACDAHVDAGRAHLIEADGDLGAVAGIELAIAAHLRASYPEPDRGMEYAATLGGAAAGIAAGAWRGARSRPTWGDAEVLRTTSVLTQSLCIAAWDLATDNERAIAGAALGGAVLGAYFGDRLTDRPDFTVGQAVLLDLSTIAGGALGLGTAYLFDNRSEHFESEAYLTGTAVGATAGYALAYLAFAKKAASRVDSGALDLGFQPFAHPGAQPRGTACAATPVEHGLAFTARF
jgi:hypothetical protein